MSEPVEIILRAGSSGRGVSWAKSVLSGCPNAIKLGLDRPRSNLVVCKGAAGIGTVFHGLQAHYHTKGPFDTKAVIFPQEDVGEALIEDVCKAEALRIHRHWQAMYPPDFFGAVQGVEVHKELEFSKFQYAPYTGDLDMITIRDGVKWVLDWKVIEHADSIETYMADPQGLFYQLLEPGARFAYVFVIRGRTQKTDIVPTVIVQELPAISDHEVKSITKWFKSADLREYAARDHLRSPPIWLGGETEKFLHLCVRREYNKIITCPYATNKECSR